VARDVVEILLENEQLLCWGCNVMGWLMQTLVALVPLVKGGKTKGIDARLWQVSR